MNLNDAVKPALSRQWQRLFDKLRMLLKYLWGVKLDSPENAAFDITETDMVMRKAKVKLSWTPSPSKDVVKQQVKIVDPDDGRVFLDKTLEPDVVEVVVEELLNEKQKVQGILVVSDGLNKSTPVVVDFVIPDLTGPTAVSDAAFSYEVVEVEDVE